MNDVRQATAPGLRKKRAPRRALERYAAIAILFLSEVLVAAGAGFAVSLWALPAAYRERGYNAVGGEWFLILAVAAIAYHIYHNWLFKQLEEPQKKEDLP
ncbi:hypothetical protein [Clostridium sp. D33t1_170424_F3]|uniref:hypothetical protein n=1 Tax=Clostridium sp. D33t1_170424_F3 TaxID=2787099 RepID=UPI0018AB5849|nr:hypothetical protein [Clostridium sp. D33t1_170424_F3]